MCRLSRKSGSLNLLEPKGPVQTCIGRALPFSRSVFLSAVRCCSRDVAVHFMFLFSKRGDTTFWLASCQAFTNCCPVAQTSDWSTYPCRLSACACSVHSELPFVSGITPFLVPTVCCTFRLVYLPFVVPNCCTYRLLYLTVVPNCCTYCLLYVSFVLPTVSCTYLLYLPFFVSTVLAFGFLWGASWDRRKNLSN
jgi:hypothetical protein